MDDVQEKSMLRVLRIIFITLALSALLPIAVCSGSRLIHVSTPTPCHTADRVEGGNVYLKSPEKPCIQAIGKVPVDISGPVDAISIYVDGNLWRTESVKEITTPELRSFLQRAEKASEDLELQTNPYHEEGRKTAAAVDSYYRSEEFQKRIQAETERIKKEVFGGLLKEMPEVAAEYYSDATQKTGKLSGSERLYILISSSVPISTLRAYARDLDRLRDPNVVMVFRGFVNGMKKIKPTLELLQEILAKNGCKQWDSKCEAYTAGIQIDPLVFQRFGVEEVPAFVYARNVQVVDTSMSIGVSDNAQIGEYCMLKGDVSLEYAISVFLKETGSNSLDALSKALQGGFYND